MKNFLLLICFCFVSSTVSAEINCEISKLKDKNENVFTVDSSCLLDFKMKKLDNGSWVDVKGVKEEKPDVCMKLFLTSGERVQNSNIWKDKNSPSKVYFFTIKTESNDYPEKGNSLLVRWCKSMKIKFKTNKSNIKK